MDGQWMKREHDELFFPIRILEIVKIKSEFMQTPNWSITTNIFDVTDIK